MSSKSKRLANARKQKRLTKVHLDMLKAGEITLVGILQSDANVLSRSRLWTVMLCTPHLAEKGAKKVLLHAKVWPETRLGDLTDEEKERIIQHLPPRLKGGGPQDL